MPIDVPPQVVTPPAIEYLADTAARAPFSPAVRVGDLVFLSGQIGMDADGNVPDGIEAQTKLALDNVKTVAGRMGLGLDSIVKCTVMLTDMRQWASFNDIYKGYFTPGRLPARSAFGVTSLALGAVVEIECIAAAQPR